MTYFMSLKGGMQELVQGIRIVKAYTAEEREDRVRRLNTLVQVGADVLSAESMQNMLETVVDAARALTRAKIGTSGHGYRQGDFQIGYTSRSPDAPVCPPGSIFSVEKGGVYMDLIDKKFSIRLTEEELQSHPRWWGLPEGHSPVKGLLGARLMGRSGEANGLIMVSHRQEGEFTAEDELLLKQLAYLASLGLHHIEAREALAKARDELEIKVQERTSELRESEERLRELSSRLLAAQEEDRLPDLVPLRHERMAESPFAYYRGTPAVMAFDLATTPRSDILVQASGDAHLSNFGLFASPERTLVFDAKHLDDLERPVQRIRVHDGGAEADILAQLHGIKPL
jgi:DNA-binding transcriptional MerR regulator